MLPLLHNYSGKQKKSYKIRCTKNNAILLTRPKFNRSDLSQNWWLQRILVKNV